MQWVESTKTETGVAAAAVLVAILPVGVDRGAPPRQLYVGGVRASWTADAPNSTAGGIFNCTSRQRRAGAGTATSTHTL